MGFFHRFLSYVGWPIIAGLAFASAYLVGSQYFHSFSKNSRTYLEPANPTVLAPSLVGPVSYSDAVKRAAPAVVSILTQKKLKRPRHPLFDDPLFRHFFDRSDIPQRERMQSSLGSGVIVKKEGYLLTNNHVISGADNITVLLRDGREAKATLVGNDRVSDLAVLKIDLDGLTEINLSSTAAAQVGDVVLAIGNPFGVGQTVTQGIISATGRDGFNVGLSELETNFIQTDAAINPGNSGGALTDAFGNLVGINIAIIGNSPVGIGFAIPADTAIKVLEDIVEFGHVVRGWLGIDIQDLSPDLAKAFNLKSTNGTIIRAIYSNSPAHQAGLKLGDIVTRINDVEVKNRRQVNLEITQSMPGETMIIEVLRRGKLRVLEAVIGTQPVYNARK